MCSSDSDCLATERCDPGNRVCIPSAINDAGGSSSDGSIGGAPSPDAASGVDATSVADAASGIDATPRVDAASGADAAADAASVADAAPAPDGGVIGLDALSPDSGPDDSGVVVCSTLDEQACILSPVCLANDCNCNGNRTYSGCTDLNAPPPSCDPVCNPTDCSALTDEHTCSSSSNCHPVYEDFVNCGCAPVGCCMRFSRCANGQLAQCQGNPTCGLPTPLCEGNFVVSYTAACYEGCVMPAECAH
jgi:hypothetical protein